MTDEQPKAEQVGSSWAKTISWEFGDELVRRWNWYEPSRKLIERLTKELEDARKGDK